MPTPMLNRATPKPRLLLLMVSTLAALTAIGIVAARLAYRVIPVTCSDPRAPGVPGVLEVFRAQIELFKMQHGGIPPDSANIEAQLQNATNVAGDVGGGRPSPDYPLGPYCPSLISNPANHQSAIGPAPAPNIGWVYIVSDADFNLQAVNTTGTTVLPY
jgi:hypothetical protein